MIPNLGKIQWTFNRNNQSDYYRQF